jgi:hypothetical protein
MLASIQIHCLGGTKAERIASGAGFLALLTVITLLGLRTTMPRG